MNWLAIIFALELGIIPNGQFTNATTMNTPFYWDGQWYVPYEVESYQLPFAFYTDLGIEFELVELLFVRGSVKIPMFLGAGGFDPQFTYYEFGAGLRKGAFEFGWRHACHHPQFTYMFGAFAKEWKEGAYDEIYLRVQGKAGLKAP